MAWTVFPFVPHYKTAANASVRHIMKQLPLIIVFLISLLIGAVGIASLHYSSKFVYDSNETSYTNDERISLIEGLISKHQKDGLSHKEIQKVLEAGRELEITNKDFIESHQNFSMSAIMMISILMALQSLIFFYFQRKASNA